jgi:hypothetical protein
MAIPTPLAYFALYPNDWLASPTIQRMTLEEQGAFLRLLCYSWTMDGIPTDHRELALLLGLEPGGERAEGILSRVLALAWHPDPIDANRLRNTRQEKQRSISSQLYTLKLAQVENARAANPRNAKGFHRSKALHKGLNKGLGENQNQTLLREKGGRSAVDLEGPAPLPSWMGDRTIVVSNRYAE